MKKIAIVVLMLGITFSYSCKKDKIVSTTIRGQVRTNGSQDIIRMNSELNQPVLNIYHVGGSSGIGTGSSHEKVASAEIDKNGNFYTSLDLIEDDVYFYGLTELDPTYYTNGTENSFYTFYLNFKSNIITAGADNNMIIYKSATGFVRPRFINTNPDPNNQDVFDLINDNIGPNQYSILLENIYIINEFLPLKGKSDTLAPWIHKTWSGEKIFGTTGLSNTHHVKGKLTRNGVTIDTIIPYFVPPFDTTVVEIRY